MKEQRAYGIELKWLSVTCFEIKFDGTTVVTDPFITESVTTDLIWEAIDACDIITLSHTHWDHITDIPRLMGKFSPKLLAGELSTMPLAKWLDCNPTMLYPMSPNLELDFGDVKIRALFGRHSNLHRNYSEAIEWTQSEPVVSGNVMLEKLQTYGIIEYRNYLFTAANGTKVLIWGSDLSIDQRNLLKQLQPDIAILQYAKYSAADTAEFAAAIGCKILIPHHMDLRLTSEEYWPRIVELEREFMSRVPDGRFVAPQRNTWMQL